MKYAFFLTIVLSVFSFGYCSVGFAEPSLTELRDKLEEYTKEPSPDLGRKRLPPEEVQTALTAYDTGREILDKNISEEFRVWTLKRKAAALITLAYEQTPRFYPELVAVVDEMDGLKDCKGIQDASERHVLLIGSNLVVNPVESEDGKKISVEAGPLAERMVLFAKANPGRESEAVIRYFLRMLDQPTVRPDLRNKRLASVVPVFADYYSEQPDEYSRAFAKDLRSVQRRLELPGKTMFLGGYDLSGELFNTASLKDKVVLVQFWGTWCKPCIQEMPQLVDLYEKYRSQGFEILGVNTSVKGDERPVTVRRFIETTTFGNAKKGITWPVIHEGISESNRVEPMSRFYGIKELPVLVLIGRNGKVVSVNPSMATLDFAIQDALTGISLDDLTEEERVQAEAARKKRDEELDRQIRQELEAIRKK